MGKFLVRITVLITTFYFLFCYYYAQFEGVDIMDDWYSVLFLAIIVIYCYSEGRYHCRHLKHLSLALLLCDILTRLDNCINFLTVYEHNLIPIVILVLGLGISAFSALNHFQKVTKLKQKREKLYGSNGIATNNNN